MKKDISIEKIYPYPIEIVWKAISTKESLEEWLMPNDFQLEIGREFTFRTKPQPGFDGIVYAKVLQFEVPNLLVYSWKGGPLRKPTTVTFALTSIAEGTKLRFSHTGFEGFFNQYILRFLLGSGWKDLLQNKITQYLNR